MANKITKREVIGMMMNEVSIKENDVYMAYLQNELALLDKKAQNKKATKTQAENVGLKAIILDVLQVATKPMTVTDIQNSNADLKALSNQKVSALIKQLVDNNTVTKATVGRKSVFSITDTDTDTENEKVIE